MTAQQPIASPDPGAVPRPRNNPVFQPRIAYIDNLRWTMIVLVISMHAADTYSPLGSWYYTDRQPLSVASLLTLAAWQMYLQSFFMGLLFFIAGSFVPASYDRRGPLQFLRERATRLGLPVLFYMFMLGPVTEYFCSHSWTSTRATSFATEWVKHIRNGEFLQENGPLWFCLALLIFCVAYVGWRSLRATSSQSITDTRPPSTRQLIVFAVVMATVTFVVRLAVPPGTKVLNMDLGDFPQYIPLFGAGILAARGRWILALDESIGIRWLAIVLPVGSVVWLIVLSTGGATAGNGDAYAGGWHWQAASMNVWESFTCVAMCYGLLAVFRAKFNTQGLIARFLSDNAFSVYVFHPPIVVMGARLLHGVLWPALIKVVILTCLSSTASFVLSAAVFRRIPLLRRVL
jgi:fucose 4-O-acetylase-like acetyltransferase